MERQAVVVGACSSTVHHSQRAAAKYAAMHSAELEHHVREDRLFMLSANQLSAREIRARRDELFALLDGSQRRAAEDLDPRSAVMVIAALPAVLDCT